MNMLKNLKSARGKAAKATSEAQAALSEIRQLRLRLLDQRDDVASRALPLDHAIEAMERALERQVEQAVGDINLSSLTRPGGREPSLNLDAHDRASLAFAAARGDIGALLRERLEAQYEGGLEALAPEEKAKRLAALDEELLSCELAEESTIRELEAAGIAVMRRSDADPRATLASDSEMAA
ncbi:hypothetical protein A3731_07865 [Roseovarius sp. HI0049]|nr:hypothetical protein A3731_07865 [Roseovarius sp. HI0049]